MFEVKINDEKKEILNFKIDLINKRHQSGSLIGLLQSAQDSYGYIPEKVIEYISELVKIPAADIYGVITFYSHIIRICEGTACHVNGAKTVLQVLQDELGITVGETSDDDNFTLLSVACLGCCSLAPVMMVNDETFGNLTTDIIKKTLKNFRSKHNMEAVHEKN
ncbi:MAG: NADH-quinone oxidoreductase subunit [Ignavibacteria bacterium]|nr:MAG: NADH-quinone oxidoreductase subunit [Ignavibacteria bacterium]